MTIIEELRQNRESGAKRLEAEYRAGLMTLARRFCADESEAAELVNRTFAAVVDGIDNYLEQSAFFGWMCQILSNIHAKDHRNKSNGIVVYPGEVPDMADEAAEDAVFRNIDRSLLREAVNGLPEDQRESIVLHYFLDIPIPKIAKILAVPGGTVKSRLHYARKALAVKLGVAVRKPGAKALLAVIALCAITAAGAAVVAAFHAATADNAECRKQNAECEDAPSATSSRSTPPGLFEATPLLEGGNTALISPLREGGGGETASLLISPLREGGGGETAGGSTAWQATSPLQPSNRQTVKPSTNQEEQDMNATLRTLAASAAFAAATAAIPATATEWFVATNGLDSADGLSEASAFLTIQRAVDAASAGDVVTVLPGIYGSGKTTVNCDGLQCHQRVFISKDLTLRSRDGASVTHIVGDWDASSATGMGDAAVRCIGVTNAATAVRIQGFTIRDGASRYASDGGDKATNRAGGVLQILNNPTPDQCSHVVVEDCVLSGNVGTRGGAIYGVTAVRCRIVGNRASNFGAAARQCRLYNCLVARNAPTTTPFSSNTDKVGAIAYGYDAVNCTVAYNESDAFRNCDYNATSFKTTTEAEKILNCVVVGNRGYVASASMSKLFNSVVEVAMPSNNCFSVNIGGAFSPLFAAPAAGDYRLIGGKPAVTSSPATSNFGGRPAEYVSTDIDGTPHGASPLCGCFAGAAGSDGDGWVEIVQAAGGTVFVDGIPATATKTNYVTAAVWPRTYDISFEPKDGKGLVCWLYATAPGATPGPRYGLSDGTMRFLPSRTAAHTTLSPLTGDAVWVSPDGSDITGDGSEANPWRTLQKGVSESGRLVLAKPGVYAEGGAVASGLMARVALTNASVRVLAVSGPEATAIVGANAAQTPAAANDLGLGPDAVRCIYLGAERTAVQGFTVAGGRTSIAANDADDSSAQLVRGGGMLSAPGYYRSNSTALLDCVVTNNAASRGAAVFGGSCERCLFADNAFTSAGNGVTRETALWACVMTRQGNTKPPFGQNTVGYNCTIAGNSAPNGGMVFQTVGLTTLRNSLLASNDGGPDIAFTNLHWCVYEDASAATIDLIANYNDLRTATRFADVAGGDFRPYSTSAAATFGSPGYWAGRNMADFAGEAFRVFDAGTSARIAAGALGGASGIVPAVVIATNRLRGGVEPLGEVAIAGETLTVAATRGYRINTVEIGGRTVEVNGRAFTVTAAEALECAPLQMMVNLYPSPFVIIIR